MRRDSAELILRDLMTEARVRAEWGGRAWRMEPSTEDSPEMRDTALHVAIIMDGTGRWAQRHNLPRTLGFRDGAKAIADVIQGALESDIEILTLCSFPVENWVRPLREVGEFASPWRHFLLTQKDEFVRRGVGVRVLGELRGFDDDTQAAVKTVVEATAKGTELRLNLMISYGGGRQEITRSARILAERVAAGELTPEEINEAAIGSTLLTAGMPSPDLVIRTAGEFRISNFMLWQLAYSEFYVSPVLWPDFNREHLFAAVSEYQQRLRRFHRTESGVREDS